MIDRRSAASPRRLAVTGHKTESVYRRYAIVNDSDLHDAAATLARVAPQPVAGPRV